jgi:hypothetical protein
MRAPVEPAAAHQRKDCGVARFGWEFSTAGAAHRQARGARRRPATRQGRPRFTERGLRARALQAPYACSDRPGAATALEAQHQGGVTARRAEEIQLEARLLRPQRRVCLDSITCLSVFGRPSTCPSPASARTATYGAVDCRGITVSNRSWGRRRHCSAAPDPTRPAHPSSRRGRRNPPLSTLARRGQE